MEQLRNAMPKIKKPIFTKAAKQCLRPVVVSITEAVIIVGLIIVLVICYLSLRSANIKLRALNNDITGANSSNSSCQSSLNSCNDALKISNNSLQRHKDAYYTCSNDAKSVQDRIMYGLYKIDAVYNAAQPLIHIDSINGKISVVDPTTLKPIESTPFVPYRDGSGSFVTWDFTLDGPSLSVEPFVKGRQIRLSSISQQAKIAIADLTNGKIQKMTKLPEESASYEKINGAFMPK
jgi:hypothetical protein